MQTPNPSRPEPRRQTPAFAGGAVHIPGNNERQLLARIAQLEVTARELVTVSKNLVAEALQDKEGAPGTIALSDAKLTIANAERVLP